MKLLTNSDVMQILDMPMAISALKTGYEDLVAGEAAYIPRIDLWAPTGRPTDYYQWGSMAGVSQSFGILAVRIKSDIVSFEGQTQTKYCVRPGLFSGMITLYSIENGEPLALIQDGFLQHMRVGAAAGLGTELMSRSDADVLGILGSGGMARTYLSAIAEVRKLRLARVYSPTKANRDRFAEEMSAELGIPVEAMSDAEQAIRGASMVVTATDSMIPTFDPAWLDDGAHVNILTRRELSDGLLARADRIVQLGVATIPPGSDVPGMHWQAGSMAAYISGSTEDRKRIPPSKRSEVGTYPSYFDVGRDPSLGRTSPEQVTLFVNVGTQGLQFASVGGATYRAAVEKGLGTDIPTEWFLEDIRN
jgi:alanine dehydrogenase